MKTNIKYSIYDLLFAILLFSMCLIVLTVLIHEKAWFLAVFWSVFLCMDIYLLFYAIGNVQWFAIRNGEITVYSPFGIVKRVQFDQIKSAFYDNAEIFRLKALSFRRPHIVLCLTKSVIKSNIADAYNRKKRKYIIVPYTEEMEALLQTEYMKYCNQPLQIKGKR